MSPVFSASLSTAQVFDLKKQKEMSEHDLRNFVDAQRLSSMDVQQAVQTAAKDKHQTQSLSRDVP